MVPRIRRARLKVGMTTEIPHGFNSRGSAGRWGDGGGGRLWSLAVRLRRRRRRILSARRPRHGWARSGPRGLPPSPCRRAGPLDGSVEPALAAQHTAMEYRESTLPRRSHGTRPRADAAGDSPARSTLQVMLVLYGTKLNRGTAVAARCQPLTCSQWAVRCRARQMISGRNRVLRRVTNRSPRATLSGELFM